MGPRVFCLVCAQVSLLLVPLRCVCICTKSKAGLQKVFVWNLIFCLYEIMIVIGSAPLSNVVKRFDLFVPRGNV